MKNIGFDSGYISRRRKREFLIVRTFDGKENTKNLQLLCFRDSERNKDKMMTDKFNGHARIFAESRRYGRIKASIKEKP
jgi:hypothetical protein